MRGRLRTVRAPRRRRRRRLLLPSVMTRGCASTAVTTVGLLLRAEARERATRPSLAAMLSLASLL
eukprot:15103643-Alexandrium_andersonii.AAC.1